MTTTTTNDDNNTKSKRTLRRRVPGSNTYPLLLFPGFEHAGGKKELLKEGTMMGRKGREGRETALTGGFWCREVGSQGSRKKGRG